MTFGDWEIFKRVIASLREHEHSSVTQTEETKKPRFLQRNNSQSEKRVNSLKTQNMGIAQADKNERVVAKQSVMEKQVCIF
ncbi:hypothetical protein LSTR_LSTR017092 [Laodelphax striatellus]|uniref:Kinase D-interacting substrate of 220 kDa-like SAM domain-containing protein n=1 Tax=Laodelphax striatellus TaxID=195883 RepID=A0A482XIU7_LAOST|nr:hypothetical protein LSTR_LSTR017092 [Laodelphax striatellus]